MLLVLGLSVLLCIPPTAAGFDIQSFGKLLPENIVIEYQYRPGLGLPVGDVIHVRGDSVIIHSAHVVWLNKTG